MPEKKNQHYVPRLLLRPFGLPARSPDETVAAVRTLLISSGKIIPAASIADQCSKNYFYGSNLTTERHLEDVEAVFSAVLPRLATEPNNFTVGSDERAAINTFMALQISRTQTAANDADDSLDRRRKYDLDPMLIAKGVATKEELDSVKMRFTEPGLFMVGIGLHSVPMLIDLHLRILTTSGRARFIISDNPAVEVNQAYAHLRGLSAVGVAMRGLQIFCPLSPTQTLLLYDGEIYRMGDTIESLRVAVTDDDVEVLNGLQVANAMNALYIPPEITDAHAHQLLLKYRRYHLKERSHVVEVRTPPGVSRSGTAILSTRHDLRVPLTWKFCRVKRRFRGDALSSPAPRDPELCRIAKTLRLDGTGLGKLLAIAMQRAAKTVADKKSAMERINGTIG